MQVSKTISRLETAAAQVRETTSKSAVLPYVNSVAQRFKNRETLHRQLGKKEIALLKAQGNSATEWKCVRVAWPRKSSGHIERVRGCTFIGNCVIGLLDSSTASVQVKNSTVHLPCGLHASTIADCIIENFTAIRDCALVANSFIGNRALLMGCGTINCSSAETSFANGSLLEVVVEGGCRAVPCFAEMDLDTAVCAAADRGDTDGQVNLLQSIEAYAHSLKAPCTIIMHDAQLLNCPLISDALIGGSSIVDASTIERCTLLSTPEEQTVVEAGACVRDSMLQWAVHVDTQAVVERSVMLTSSYAERHGKVLDAIIGPFTGVAEGEVSSSLLGPFVGFHHQALLIACFWPAGKGNIGYGANVGSNHTGKAPDQELWPGEGVFFGLGVNIKFPSDLSKAVYSLVATGVNTLPQRVEFPFSLIASPDAHHDGINPALNQIRPGWILSQNVYMIIRNETKFAKRGGKSKRLTVGHQIFRPSIVELMRTSRDVLQQLGGGDTDMYTSRQLPGLGKNYMSEASRVEAVETYARFIKRYGLYGLLAKARQVSDSSDGWGGGDQTLRAFIDKHSVSEVGADMGTWDYCYTGVVTRSGAASRAPSFWAHQSLVLVEEFGEAAVAKRSVESFLQDLVQGEERLASDTLKSKSKDNKRGEATIAGYNQAHGLPQDVDAVVKQAISTAAEIGRQVTDLCGNNKAPSMQRRGSTSKL